MAEQDKVTEAQRLLAEIQAKYGAPAAGPAEQPKPQAQPAPAPKEEPGSLLKRAAGIFGGRKDQIDKAAGYACGGKVKAHACGGKVKAHAAGGQIKTIKGPGTSTSDSIPAKVKETGEPILVSNGERILSKKQDQLLSKIAKALGYESTDALLASGTGRPVGPTMKDGKKAARYGANGEWIPDPADDVAPKDWSLANSPDEYTKALKSGPSVAAEMFPNTSAVYKEVGKDVGDAVSKGNYANAFGLATRGMLATGVGLVDDVIGNPIRAALPVAKNVGSGLAGNVQPSPAEQQKKAEVQPPEGLLKEAVAPGYTLQDGPQQVSPLVTGRNDNGVITAESAQQYLGSDMRDNKVGPNGQKTQIFGTYDGKGVNDILARENAARAGMIDSMIAANGGNGIGLLAENTTLPGGISRDEWNRNVGVKTRLGLDEKSQAAYEDQMAKNELHRAANETARYGHDVQAQRAAGHDSVLMRGQDIQAQTDAAKIIGNPAESRLRLAQAADAEQISALRGQFLNAKTPEEQARIKALLNSISGRSADDKPWAHVVGGGVDPTTGQVAPQYIVTGRGDQATTASTGADIANRAKQKPVPEGYTVAGTSGGKRVLKDAKGNRFLEG